MQADGRTPLRGAGEIAEDEAGPQLRAVYARIAAMLGVPFVPTIYRMLGRWPAWLDASAEALAPLLDAPRAGGIAAAMRERAATAGLDGEPIRAGADAPQVLAVLGRYNTANPLSLIFATALLPGAPAPAGIMTPPVPEPAPAGSADPASVLEDVRLRHGAFVLPGVWRELAAWPQVLDAAWGQVRPLAGVPAYQETREALRRMARAATGGLRAPAPEEHGVPDGDLQEVARIAGWFAHGIPAVVVEIEYLRRLVAS